MMATLMPTPTDRPRSSAPCAPEQMPWPVSVATAQDSYVATTSNRWLGALGSIVRHTDTFGTKRTHPDRLAGGLT